MQDDVVQQMIGGIDDSACIVVFLTKAYIDKVNSGNRADNCLKEFNYANMEKTSAKMIAVPMEPCCLNPKDWKGVIKMELGGQLYECNFANDDDTFDENIDKLYTQILRKCDITVPQESPRSRASSEIPSAPVSNGGTLAPRANEETVDEIVPKQEQNLLPSTAETKASTGETKTDVKHPGTFGQRPGAHSGVFKSGLFSDGPWSCCKEKKRDVLECSFVETVMEWSCCGQRDENASCGEIHIPRDRKTIHQALSKVKSGQNMNGEKKRTGHSMQALVGFQTIIKRIVFASGTFKIDDANNQYATIKIPVELIGTSPEETILEGGLELCGEAWAEMKIKNMTLRGSRASGIKINKNYSNVGTPLEDMLTLMMDNVVVDKSTNHGINTLSNLVLCHNVVVQNCGRRGVYAHGTREGSGVTFSGPRSSVRNNCTDGKVDFGIHVDGAMKKIFVYLIKPLKKTMAHDNGKDSRQIRPVEDYKKTESYLESVVEIEADHASQTFEYVRVDPKNWKRSELKSGPNQLAADQMAAKEKAAREKAAALEQAAKKYYIVTDQVGESGHRIRERPTTDATQVGTLNEGDVVSVTEIKDNWLKIGQNNWTLSKLNESVYLRIKSTTWVLDAPGLADKQTWGIRKGPSTSTETLRLVYNGAKVQGVGIKDGWLELADGGGFSLAASPAHGGWREE